MGLSIEISVEDETDREEDFAVHRRRAWACTAVYATLAVVMVLACARAGIFADRPIRVAAQLIAFFLGAIVFHMSRVEKAKSH